MELRTFAERVFGADTLEGKLASPDLATLTDQDPGRARAWREPGRPASLKIAPRKKRKKMPSLRALEDPVMVARTLHTFANHELMALELMAWALLAYPGAPPAFRRGLAWLMVEEQRHTQLYLERLSDLGVRLGDLPVNDHFWRVAPSLTTPTHWVCAMNLTFEQANLDHALVYAARFQEIGDEASASLMQTILEDEVSHVGFGLRWLETFKRPDQPIFEAYTEHLTDHHTPDRARGAILNVEARERARMPQDFLEGMRQAKSVSQRARQGA